jgi:DNA-binding NtrC family response regulator
MKTPAILVADDDPEVLNYLETALLCHKYPVIAARDGSEALSLLEEHKEAVSAVVLDAMMPCKDGVETLQEIRRRYPELPVVVISGACDPERIVEVMKAGAQEYLTKPVVHEKLLDAIRRTTAAQPPRAEVKSLEAAAPPQRYVQVNPLMRAIHEALRKTAAWNVPVVLRGESGVGKEVLARELHLLSPRASKEFVKINCVALPSELLESELFGYERGAFTGAFRAKPGKFELADGGTILLDEIGDMDLKLQAKLLQVLQDGEVHRLGGKEPVRVDVRVLVATHRDLEKSIAEGNFREDLYYRLNVVSIEVPPLRERKDEILPLAEHFLEKHCQPDAKPPVLTDELKRAFLTHDWPGNVRELENVVRRYLVFEDAGAIVRQLLAASSARAGLRFPDGRSAEDFSGPTSDTADPRALSLSDPRDGYPDVMGRAYPGNRADADGSGRAYPDLANRTYADGARAMGSTASPLRPPGIPALYKVAARADSGHAFLNGTHASATSVEPMARPPVLESAGKLAADPNVPGAALCEADPGLSSALPAGDVAFVPSLRVAVPRNSDAWMSRLARLESLLGCLVLGVPEKLPSVSESPSAEPPPMVSENGRSFVTLDELDEQRNRVEMQAILAALEKTEWNRKKAAKLLKTDYKALLYRMKKLGVGERNDQM